MCQFALSVVYELHVMLTVYLMILQGSNLATLPPPNSVLEVLLINCEIYFAFPHCILSIVLITMYLCYVYECAVPRGMLYGCGDLIFSSHMIFSLVFVRTYHKYGTRRWYISGCVLYNILI